MTKRLEGKVALVTGASKGIGAEIAIRLAAEGAAVASITARASRARTRVVAAITGKGGKAVAVHGNLTDAGDVKTVVAETIKAFGPIDILVNNAGLYEFAPLDGITAEHFHKHFDLNVLGLCWSRRKPRDISMRPAAASSTSVRAYRRSRRRTPPSTPRPRLRWTPSLGAVEGIGAAQDSRQYR